MARRQHKPRKASVRLVALIGDNLGNVGPPGRGRGLRDLQFLAAATSCHPCAARHLPALHIKPNAGGLDVFVRMRSVALAGLAELRPGDRGS
jgi:hypothetical protein